MLKRTTTICAALALGLLLPATAGAAGSQPSSLPANPQASDKTPEEMAKSAYNLGLKHRDKAWALEDKAEAAASEEERQKHLKKAHKQYEKAIPLFKTATEKAPSLHQAFSSLGYALRKTGDYDASLKAYDKALDLAPFYGEAIEYRAEAYLGLDRLDEVKEAYMQLFAKDRPLADQLMEAMQGWVEERRAEPGGVSSETIDAFASWVKERGELADQTAQLSAAARSW